MDMMKFSITSTFLLLLLAAHVDGQGTTFDVTKYGATPNADISEALTHAWTEACAGTNPGTIVIPKGTYTSNQVTLQGPCKAAITVQFQGTLKAPGDPTTFKQLDQGWINFNYIDRFTLSGGGIFDGQGANSWKQNSCHKTAQACKLPNNLGFNFINNSIIQDITSLDSKFFHVNVFGCKNVTFQRFTVTAPETSVNTDGIHVGHSTGVTITDSTIKTGDDCVSIGDGAQQVTINGVKCGPGHGISVGSLGKYQNEQDVVGIYVKNCTLTGTTNGVRVKTWPSSQPGIATDLHFEDITMENVFTPVLIDQEYCPWNNCQKQNPSKVKLSKISFKNIKGTSATQLAVKLTCSKGIPCETVEVADIDLKYNGKEGPATSQCDNVKPNFSGNLNPPACGASPQGPQPK